MLHALFVKKFTYEDLDFPACFIHQFRVRLAKLYTGYMALGYIAMSHITFPVWLYMPKER